MPCRWIDFLYAVDISWSNCNDTFIIESIGYLRKMNIKLSIDIGLEQFMSILCSTWGGWTGPGVWFVSVKGFFLSMKWDFKDTEGWK